MDKLSKRMNGEVEPKIDPRSWLFFGIFAVIVAVVFCGFLLRSTSQLQRTESALRSWTKHVGQIEKMEVHRTKYRNLHVISGSYLWGKERHSFYTPKIELMEWWRMTGNEFTVGDSINLHVDPTEPWHTVVEAEIQLGLYQTEVAETRVVTAVTGLVGLLCLFIFWISKHRKENLPIRTTA